jgi:hypothetical protein
MMIAPLFVGVKVMTYLLITQRNTTVSPSSVVIAASRRMFLLNEAY